MKELRKTLAFVLTVLMIFTMLPPVTVYADAPSESWQDEGTPDTGWYTVQTEGGKGTTEANPYIIDTAEELAGLAKLVNGGNPFADKFIKLSADIDLSGKEWVPIGSNSYRFGGAFDGDGHTISNMTIHLENYDWAGMYGVVGLFGWMSIHQGWQGTYGIKNLGVVNADISGQVANCGVLAGEVDLNASWKTPVLENCFSTGRISSGITTATLGGLFGNITKSNASNSNLTIRNCYSSCDIAATNVENSGGYTRYTGGLIGRIQDLGSGALAVSNCYSASRVRAANPDRTRMGGFVGHVNSAFNITMTDCLFDTQAAGVDYGFSGLGVSFGGVEGRLTSAMTGAAALPAGWNTSIWLTERDLYPRLQIFGTGDGSSLASAIPLFLYENAGLSDTRAIVRHSFTVPEIDDAEWSAVPEGILTFEGGLAEFTSPAVDTEVEITAELPSGAKQTYTVLCKSGVDPDDKTPPAVSIGGITPSDFSASVPVTSDEKADIYVLTLPAADDEPAAGAIVADARTKKCSGTEFTAEVGGLAHSTDYIAYAVAIDPVGNVSDVESEAFTTQQDHTPPSWQSTGSMTISGGTVYFDCSYNESGTLKYVVLPAAQPAPNKEQVAAGKDASGNLAYHAATQPYPGGYADISIVVSGFTPNNYRIYLVCEDAFGNISSVFTSAILFFTISGTVTFTVTDGVDPIQDASVTVGTTTKTTNANGQTVFTLSGGDHSYWITAEGYGDASGSFTVDESAESVPVALTVIIPVTLINAVADGVAGTATSTKIDLTFDVAVLGLTSDNITITDGTGAVVEGALTGSGTDWSVVLSSVTVQGDVSVAVSAPAGYSISGSPKNVTVYRALSADATLSDLTVNGITVAGFDAADLSYDVELPYGTLPGSPAATVGATAHDTTAEVVITQTAVLPGSAFVQVIAEDGVTTETYTVNFEIESPPAYTGPLYFNVGEGENRFYYGDPSEGGIVAGDLEGWSFEDGILTLEGFEWRTAAKTALAIVGGDLTIRLADGSENSIISNFSGSKADNDTYGICALENLTIKGGTEDTGSLTVAGGGSQKSDSIGIFALGDLQVDGGRVIASGNGFSGTDSSRFCFGLCANSVTINGGTVHATAADGKTSSFGIFSLFDVTVSGGGAHAVSGQASGGGTITNRAGISAGIGTMVGNVSISGGTVTAKSGPATNISAGIGAYGGSMNISGGTVVSTADLAANPAGAANPDGISTGIIAGNVTIFGGTVTAAAGSTPDESGVSGGIMAVDPAGSGHMGDVTISGGTVTATAGEAPSGVSGGIVTDDEIVISGGIMTATGNREALFSYIDEVTVTADTYRYWTNTEASESGAAGPTYSSITSFDNNDDVYKYVKIAPSTTYSLTITAGTGGSITTGSSGSYEEGAVITIAASANTNYSFNKWTSEGGGSFVNANSASTTFTMPAGAATITAQFTYNGGGSGGGGTPSAKTYTAVVSDGSTLPVSVNTAADSASVNLGGATAESLAGGGSTTVTVPSIPEVSSYIVNLPSSSLAGSNGEGTLTLETGLGSVTIPGNMLSGTNLTGNAGITISEGNKNSLPDDVKAALGDRPVIQLTLTVNGQPIGWNNQNAPVTVSIPYTPTVAELQNPESIVVWYIDGSGNVISMPNGHYDPATGTVTFSTTHFSQYAVAYNRVAFNDVPAGAWYEKAVSFLAAREITTGTGNGNYSPEAKLNRGEFLVMVMRAYGIAPDQNPPNNFSDAANTWYTGYLAAAKRLGISAGVGDNLFAPEREVTRQEMFTLLYNTLKELDQLPAGTEGKELSAFSDAGQIASWANEAMTFFARTGVIAGNGGKLSPLDTSTRAQMGQVLYILLSK